MSEIIARAMNSTLGTSNFKAFDELIRLRNAVASDDFITNVPETQWAVVNWIGEEFDYEGNPTNTVDVSAVVDTKSFRIPIKGTVKMSFPVRTTISAIPGHGNPSIKSTIYLYKNDTLIATVSGASATYLGEATDETKTVVFNGVVISPGDVFVIKLSLVSSSGWCKGNAQVTEPVTISGTLMEYVPVDIIS